MNGSEAAILFDYGNVLTLPADDPHFLRIGAIAGADPGRIAESYSRHRSAYDGGGLTGADYWERVLGELGIRPGDDVTDALIREDIRRWSRMNEAVLEWVRDLSADGWRLGLLSNITPDHARYLLEEAAWLRFFPVRIFSCEHRIAKPHPAIYRTAVRALGVRPEACIFFDDLPENVEAARREGIRAVRFTQLSEAKEALRLFAEEYARA